MTELALLKETETRVHALISEAGSVRLNGAREDQRQRCAEGNFGTKNSDTCPSPQ